METSKPDVENQFARYWRWPLTTARTAVQRALLQSEDQGQYFENLLPKPEYPIAEQNMFRNIF